MKVVDAIARILKIEGAEFLSAYPTTPMIEAAAAAEIRPVLCRQERVGVGIADGYARVTNGKTLGRRSACSTAPGPRTRFPASPPRTPTPRRCCSCRSGTSATGPRSSPCSARRAPSPR